MEKAQYFASSLREALEPPYVRSQFDGLVRAQFMTAVAADALPHVHAGFPFDSYCARRAVLPAYAASDAFIGGDGVGDGILEKKAGEALVGKGTVHASFA